jgi:hypothetical protein
MTLYSDYRAGGLSKRMSILELLDKLDSEFNRINNFGRWTRKDSPQILALTFMIQNLQSQLSEFQNSMVFTSCCYQKHSYNSRQIPKTTKTTSSQRW